MLLALDIGNTNITVGAFQGERLLKLWRLATDTRKTPDEYGVTLSALVSRGVGRGGGHEEVGSREPAPRHIKSVIYGSVVPALSGVLESAVRSYFGLKALRVSAASPLGIRLKVRRPREVGVDRLLNALAVFRLYGGPAVVLDFGTATTFDCVSARGDYLGGAILIGPAAAARALAEYTAQLPRVALGRPRRMIGKSTVECIQGGLYYGYLGMVERVLRGTLAEMRSDSRGGRIRVIATGGLAEAFAGDIPQVWRVTPDLTLQGLRLAYDILR